MIAPIPVALLGIPRYESRARSAPSRNRPVFLNPMMKLGLMGAMPEEVDGIRAEMEVTGTQEIAGRTYTLGRWHGAEVVLVFSRCGKVSSASTATTLLQHFGVDAILFVGVAGAVHPDLRIGDIVIASELIQHDMDASGLPIFQRFEIPLLGRARFPAPADWVDRAAAATEAYLHGDFVRDFDAETRREFVDNGTVSGLEYRIDRQ